MNSPLKHLLFGLLACTLLSGCAEKIQTEDGRTYDPLEGMNRDIYGFNTYLDKNAIAPVATAYRDYVPEAGRTGIHNALQNLGTAGCFRQ